MLTMLNGSKVWKLEVEEEVWVFPQVNTANPDWEIGSELRSISNLPRIFPLGRRVTYDRAQFIIVVNYEMVNRSGHGWKTGNLMLMVARGSSI